jgi:hypothetical protein
VVFSLLVLTGALNNILMVLNNALLQTYTDADYRGRVLSVYMLMWGLTPLGTLPAGAISDRVGVPLVIGVQGALVALLFFLGGRLQPGLKQLE